MNILSHAIYKGVFCTIFLLSLLPMRILYAISFLIYLCLYRLTGYRKEVSIQNVARAFPDLKYQEVTKIVNDFYINFSNLFVEVLKYISASAKQMDEKLEVKGFDFVERQISEGKNVIACMGHCSNWEILNYLPRKVSANVYSGYKPIKISIMNRLMHDVRSRFGTKLIPSRSIARHILSNKKTPALYLLIADQCPKTINDQFLFTFLNQKTSVYSGTEKLAKAVDAAVVYIKMTRTRRGAFKAECLPICESAKASKEQEITELYIKHLEQTIIEQPDSWLWTHKRWKR